VHHETTNPTPSFVFLTCSFLSLSLSFLASRLGWRARGGLRREQCLFISSVQTKFFFTHLLPLSISPFFIFTPMACGVYCVGRCQVRLGKVRGKKASLAGVRLVGGFDCIHSFWLLGLLSLLFIPSPHEVLVGFSFPSFSLGKHRLSIRFNLAALCVCCAD